MPQLSKKEKMFCRKYLESGDAVKAAYLSGIKKDPYSLLNKEEIKSEIKSLGETLNKNSEYIAKSALMRLAVGNVSDAVSLLFKEETGKSELEKLDLFMVSEIKRKGDTTEIKFFDRFKAINSLLEGFENEQSAVPFYEALKAGAKAIKENDNGD